VKTVHNLPHLGTTLGGGGGLGGGTGTGNGEVMITSSVKNYKN
jgi:hypothetical protein